MCDFTSSLAFNIVHLDVTISVDISVILIVLFHVVGEFLRIVIRAVL